MEFIIAICFIVFIYKMIKKDNCSITANSAGEIRNIRVSEGSLVRRGDNMGLMYLDSGGFASLVAENNYEIVKIYVSCGEKVSKGTRIFEVRKLEDDYLVNKERKSNDFVMREGEIVYRDGKKYKVVKKNKPYWWCSFGIIGGHFGIIIAIVLAIILKLSADEYELVETD